MARPISPGRGNGSPGRRNTGFATASTISPSFWPAVSAVSRILAESFKWFAIAAEQGDTDAAGKRDEVAARLDERARAEAEAEVEVWRARVPDPQANEVIVPEQARSATLTQAGISPSRSSAS